MATPSSGGSDGGWFGGWGTWLPEWVAPTGEPAAAAADSPELSAPSDLEQRVNRISQLLDQAVAQMNAPVALTGPAKVQMKVTLGKVKEEIVDLKLAEAAGDLPWVGSIESRVSEQFDRLMAFGGEAEAAEASPRQQEFAGMRREYFQRLAPQIKQLRESWEEVKQTNVPPAIRVVSLLERFGVRENLSPDAVDVLNQLCQHSLEFLGALTGVLNELDEIESLAAAALDEGKLIPPELKHRAFGLYGELMYQVGTVSGELDLSERVQELGLTTLPARLRDIAVVTNMQIFNDDVLREGHLTPTILEEGEGGDEETPERKARLTRLDLTSRTIPRFWTVPDEGTGFRDANGVPQFNLRQGAINHRVGWYTEWEASLDESLEEAEDPLLKADDRKLDPTMDRVLVWEFGQEGTEDYAAFPVSLKLRDFNWEGFPTDLSDEDKMHYAFAYMVAYADVLLGTPVDEEKLLAAKSEEEWTTMQNEDTFADTLRNVYFPGLSDQAAAQIKERFEDFVRQNFLICHKQFTIYRNRQPDEATEA